MPVVTILGGNNQSGQPGGFVANPLSVLVQNAAGQPYVGAAVTFAAGAGGGQLQGAASNQSAASVGVRTDATGQALAYFQLPNNPGGTSQITATAGSAGQLAQATFTATAFDTTGGGSSPYGPTDVVANYYPDGSADITWTSTAAPDDTTLVPLQERDINGNWTTLAMVAANSSSYHVDAAAAPPAPAAPNTPAAPRAIQVDQNVLSVQTYIPVDISGTYSNAVTNVALDEANNAAFMYWDGSTRKVGLWRNGALVESPKPTASQLMTWDFESPKPQAAAMPVYLLQELGIYTYLNASGSVAMSHTVPDWTGQTQNIHATSATWSYGVDQTTDVFNASMGGFAGGGLADFEDPGVLLNNGTMYGHGSMGYDPEKPRRTPSSSCIGTLAVGGGGPQADDLIPDPPVAPDTYFYTTNTAFSAISPGGNLGLYYECIDNGPGNKTEWTLIESGSGGLQLLDATGQTGIAAINDSADFVGNDAGGVFLTENTPPVPGAPPNPDLGLKRYLSNPGPIRGGIPANVVSKIRNIHPLMMSNRAVPVGTAVQPLFNILFTAETLRTETPVTYWQNTTFLLRKFSDGSTDLHEAVVPANADLVSMNASGVIAALGDPNGGGLWHALLLTPVPAAFQAQPGRVDFGFDPPMVGVPTVDPPVPDDPPGEPVWASLVNGDSANNNIQLSLPGLGTDVQLQVTKGGAYMSLITPTPGAALSTGVNPMRMSGAVSTTNGQPVPVITSRRQGQIQAQLLGTSRVVTSLNVDILPKRSVKVNIYRVSDPSSLGTSPVGGPTDDDICQNLNTVYAQAGIVFTLGICNASVSIYFDTLQDANGTLGQDGKLEGAEIGNLFNALAPNPGELSVILMKKSGFPYDVAHPEHGMDRGRNIGLLPGPAPLYQPRRITDFVFVQTCTDTGVNVSDAIAHEIGHTLGIASWYDIAGHDYGNHPSGTEFLMKSGASTPPAWIPPPTIGHWMRHEDWETANDNVLELNY